MFYLAVGLILAIMYGMEYLEKNSTRKQTEKLEKLHADMYAWIDENVSNKAIARERKAEVDLMIHGQVEKLNRKYEPENIKEVTSKKERKEREQASIEGKPYYSKELVEAALMEREPTEEERWLYTRHKASDEDSREHLINSIMKRTGITREDAEKRADKMLNHMANRKEK